MAFSEISASSMMSVGNITNIEFFFACPTSLIFFAGSGMLKKVIPANSAKADKILWNNFLRKERKNKIGCYLATTFLSW